MLLIQSTEWKGRSGSAYLQSSGVEDWTLAGDQNLLGKTESITETKTPTAMPKTAQLSPADGPVSPSKTREALIVHAAHKGVWRSLEACNSAG